MELSLLFLVCIHKSYIVYLEIYVVPIGHGFSFFGNEKVMEKSWKINVEKGGTLCLFVCCLSVCTCMYVFPRDKSKRLKLSSPMTDELEAC